MDKIQIKCTSCGQKFAVTESYIGRMVECGACDDRFKVEGSAIVRQRKHYPGEKSDANAEVYSKSPSSESAKNNEVAFQTANYQNVSADYAQPPKPLKTLMICAGTLFILSFIALFLLGGREEGMLEGLDNTKRFILAGFVALTGSSLIILGSRHKSKGLLLSLILGGSLVAMPFIYPEVLDSKIITESIIESETTDKEKSDSQEEIFNQQLKAYKTNIGFEKVEAARISLDNPNDLKAIVLVNSKGADLDIILPYLQYQLGLQDTPVEYPYGREINGESATLLTFVTDTPIERVFEITKRFGQPQEMNEIRTALKVIEIVVDRSTLQGRSTELTTNPNHPEYFNANHSELRGIDRAKQMDAAKRLETATSKGRQADIATALSELININDHEVSRQAITTLYHWNLPEYNNDQNILDYAKKIAGTAQMHRSVMNYLADIEIPGSEEILAIQWASKKGNLLWENHLIRAKKRGEKAVISTLPSLDETHFRSAANILSKVGTADSITSINNLLPRASEDDKKYLKAAIDEIKSRQ